MADEDNLKQAEVEKRNKLKQEKPYVYEKIMRFNDKVKRGESIAIIQFQYDYACNFKCPHCCIKRFQEQGKEQGRFFTIQDVRELSRQADEIGLAHIVITGGEPLVFPDLDELVKAIDPQKFYITSDTNGWLLDEKKAKHLKDIGVDKVQISLDSISPENPDNFHDIKDSNERALKAVDFALNAGLNVIVQTVVTKQRVRSQELIDFIEYLNKKGVGVFITYAKPVGAFEGRFDTMVDKSDMDYVRELEKKYNVFTHLTPSYGLDLGCIGVKRMISITKYGDVMPCPYIHVSLGNFFKEPLKNIVERGLKTKQFGEHCDTCWIAEDKDFVNKYIAGRIYGKKIPVPFNEFFDKEDIIEKPDFYREIKTEKKIKLSDYVVKFLEGVTDSVFLVSGGGCMHTVDSIGRSKLNSYCCHHEQACALAAEGYSRINNNKIGVASVTTGPGGTNAITGVGAAWVDGIPMMVLSGQVRKEVKLSPEDIKNGLRRLGEPQEINLLECVKPITKYAVCVENPEEIKYHLEKAYYLAKSGKPGPVWIEIPLDVQRTEIDENKLIGFEIPNKPKYAIPFKEIANALNKAEKPLLLVGNGIRLADAIPELQEFIKKTNINVITAMSGTDLVDHNYPNYLGEQGLTGVPRANYGADNCDLLLVIGTRLQIRQTSFEYKKFAKNAFKIMVDIDNAELYKRTLNIDIPVCANAKDFLQGILKEEISLKKWEVPKMSSVVEADKNYVNVYKFLENLSEKCDYPVITTNGMCAETSHQALKLKSGQRLITNTAFGEMGKGLPMAVGACAANNKKPAICFEGDGSIMMNIQELQTVIYNKLPIKIFIFNNGGYYSIRNTHLKFFNKIFAADESSGVGLPNWSRLAPGWGIEYESIKNEADFYKIKKVLDFNGPIICEVFIDPNQPKLPKWEAS